MRSKIGCPVSFGGSPPSIHHDRPIPRIRQGDRRSVPNQWLPILAAGVTRAGCPPGNSPAGSRPREWCRPGPTYNPGAKRPHSLPCCATDSNVTAVDGPGVYRRSRQGGWQNDCSENRRSGGVCVVAARDLNPGGPGPGSITLAWRPTIDAARCHDPGKACSRLQAAEGSGHQAHAAARPQHRARASATRVERRPGLTGCSAVFQPMAVPAWRRI